MSKPKYDSDKVAHALKVGRAKARMDQQALADAAGISKDSVARYETGLNTPRLDTAFDMAVALGISLDELACLPASSLRGEAE